jgi:competence protein ComGF
MQKIENIIIVRSKTRLEQLTERFNTVEQAKFYVTQQKKSFDFKRSASKISKRKRNASHEYGYHGRNGTERRPAVTCL